MEARVNDGRVRLNVFTSFMDSINISKWYYPITEGARIHQHQNIELFCVESNNLMSK